MTAPAPGRARGAADGCFDDDLLERLTTTYAQSTSGAFVREIAALLAACPAARFGTLAVELVRAPAEAAQAGACLNNCLRGAGRWRFSHCLLAGVLIARISDGERLAGLFTVQVGLTEGGPGIRAKASAPQGVRNSDLPDNLNAAARQYARMLEEGGFGLDRYALIVRAVKRATRWTA
jgi:hypothetical protein